MKISLTARAKPILLLLAAIAISAILYGVTSRVYYMRAYPLHYMEYVLEQENSSAVPSALIMAVIRTESGFDPEAQSSVGARGLMQITEDTFNWAKWRRGAPSEDTYDDLFEPRTNIGYGVYILSTHYQEYGSFELALCAYHAGRGSVNRWLSDAEYSADGISLSHIPFDDTGRYVAKVMQTMEIYRNLYKELEE